MNGIVTVGRIGGRASSAYTPRIMLGIVIVAIIGISINGIRIVVISIRIRIIPTITVIRIIPTISVIAPRVVRLAPTEVITESIIRISPSKA
jgi:hypothetical protein